MSGIVAANSVVDPRYVATGVPMVNGRVSRRTSLAPWTSWLNFAKFLYISSALGVAFINYGSLDSIIITRIICLTFVMLANSIIIIKQFSEITNKYSLASQVSLLILFIGILITYVFYIHKSGTLDQSKSILTNSFSNSFVALFVLLCIYLFYSMEINMPTAVYGTLLVFCSLMICVLYPLIITIVYYKTDGFKNIYI